VFVEHAGTYFSLELEEEFDVGGEDGGKMIPDVAVHDLVEDGDELGFLLGGGSRGWRGCCWIVSGSVCSSIQGGDDVVVEG
jgi:hypothetical protein